MTSPGPLRAAVLVAALGSLVTETARAEDAWLGEDKALHFSVSAVLAGGGYAGSSLFLDRAWQRATAGAGFSLALGGAKELHDLAGHGDPSWRDFAWDVAGTAVGVALALAVDAALSSGKPSEATAATEPLAIRF